MAIWCVRPISSFDFVWGNFEVFWCLYGGFMEGCSHYGRDGDERVDYLS